MITKETSMCSCNGVTRERQTFYALSTDEKPTQGIGNADIFFEMDTGSVYMYDADNAQWLQI